MPADPGAAGTSNGTGGSSGGGPILQNAGRGGVGTEPPPMGPCGFPKPVGRDDVASALVRELAQPDCLFQLGEPINVPLPASVPWQYRLSSDLNGDGVGDLLYQAADARSSNEGEAPVVVVLSRLDEGRLTFEKLDCSGLGQLPRGRFFVGELDGDGTLDWLIGTEEGLVGFLRTEWGIRETLEYRWQASRRGRTFDLGSADLDGNGQPDIISSYERIVQESNNFERGVLVLMNRGPSNFDAQAWSTEFELQPHSDEPVVRGFAVDVSTGNLPRLLIVHSAASDSVWSELLVSFNRLEPENHTPVELAVPFGATANARAYAAWFLPFQGRVAAALLSNHHLAFYDLSQSAAQPIAPFYVRPTASEHSMDGGEGLATPLMLDIDGDGDLDFVEEASVGGTNRFVVHRNREGLELSPPAEFEVSHLLERRSPSPFVAVGPAQGALLVNTSPPDEHWATVQPLECAER